MSMKKEASSLSELGFDVNFGAGFFRQVPSSGCDNGEGTQRRRQLTKVSVIGAGDVGMAIAQTILPQGLADEIALVDSDAGRVRGEMLDLQHAAAFLPRVRIVAGTDVVALTRGSDLAIFTLPGARPVGHRGVELLRKNVAVLREVVPAVAEGSPDSLLLVVSNPVDVLAYAAWKLSGFPASRVIGSGTNLDSSRLRRLLADHLGVGAQDVHAYMVGEHGGDAVALWSSISVGGMPVLSYLQKTHASFDGEALEGIRRAVVGGAREVIGLKGYASWAIGYSVASLARSLLRDQRRVHPVSLLAKGFIPGNDREVFLSLPARLGRGGVLGVAAELELTADEESTLRRSAETLWEHCQALGI
jgi:L-lactate dehydrogenase